MGNRALVLFIMFMCIVPLITACGGSDDTDETTKFISIAEDCNDRVITEFITSYRLPGVFFVGEYAYLMEYNPDGGYKIEIESCVGDHVQIYFYFDHLATDEELHIIPAPGYDYRAWNTEDDASLSELELTTTIKEGDNFIQYVVLR